MRAIDMWGADSKPTLSFELFPAKTEKAAGNLEKAIEALCALKPNFVSVTFGAGGSTTEGSRQLVEKLKQDMGLEVIAYFAGYGLGPDDITGAGKADADAHFVRFRPPALDPENGQTALPHIRLDRAMHFLLGDRLA